MVSAPSFKGGVDFFRGQNKGGRDLFFYYGGGTNSPFYPIIIDEFDVKIQILDSRFPKFSSTMDGEDYL